MIVGAIEPASYKYVEPKTPGCLEELRVLA